MSYKHNARKIGIYALCFLLVLCFMPTLVLADQDFAVDGLNYVLPDDSNYDYTGMASVNSFFYGSKSLGTLLLIGTENKGTTDNGYVAYGTKKSVSIRYSYSGSYQYKNPDNWYVDKDDTRWIRSYDVGFLNNIAHGCIMVERSQDSKTWEKVIEPIRDYFSGAKTTTESTIYTIPESEIRNGCYFRVVVAYRFARRTKDNLIFDDYDHKKCVEVYEFYLILEDNKLVSGNVESLVSTSSPKPTATIQEKNTSSNQNEKAIVNIAPTPLTFYEAIEVKNRGLLDNTGKEPDYTGTIGFAAVYTEAKLEENGDFAKTPWKIPVFQKTHDSMIQVGTIDHKTKIGIIDQNLSKQNGKESHGYLEYQELSSGKTGFIDVKNYVTNQYWKETISTAVEEGYCVASFKQKSKYTPVNKNGERVNIKDGTKILLPARGTYYISVMDRINYQILGIVFIERNNKAEPQYVFFNKNDLSMIY